MKPIYGIGMLLKKEASYNAGGTVSTSTDALLLDEPVKLSFSRANDGARPAPPGGLGYQRRITPIGRTVSLTPKHSAKGAGAAYSSSVVPSPHVALQIAGFDAAVTVTGGAEKWVYTPTPITSTPSSGVASVYGRGQLCPMQALYADLSITIDGPGVPVWEFAMQGLAPSAITDVNLPTITYPLASIDPPAARGITFTLGNMTGAIVRKLSLKMARGIQPALDVNTAAGHSGFRPQRRTPTLDVTFETPALVGSPFTATSTIDPYQLFEAGTQVACSFQVGSTQYNRWKFAAGYAQIMSDPVEEEDGATALTTLSLQINPSALNANDDVTITFD